MLHYTMTVLLEYIDRSLYTIFHKCLILLLILILQYAIVLALCLMLSMTYYALNYAGIISRSLYVATIHCKQCHHVVRYCSAHSVTICIVLPINS